jgi:lipopolysaccharide/colanic/teichoic acid biosynthesis glycosyltransferase
VNRLRQSSHYLGPQRSRERLGLPCRNTHAAPRSAGRIHFSSCSSSRAVQPHAASFDGLAIGAPMTQSRTVGFAKPAGMVLLDSPPATRSLRATRTLQQTASHFVKRTLDRIIAAVALVMLSPVMLLCALAIRRESRGPILYSQVRVGLDRRRRPAASMNGSERRSSTGYGRPFRIFKFRSMVQGAERKTGAVWCAENDPRITKVGNFLRRTHLDEIPQLVNVLRGEMSIVGPRPERPEFVERLAAEIPGYRQRSTVLPGITGLAQVKYRYDRDMETARTKLLYDLHYIRNTGLLFDVKIMAATVGVMAKVDHGQV